MEAITTFVLGSVTKTCAATALMCLVEKGLVELKAPVRRYVPGLKLYESKIMNYVMEVLI